MGFEENAFVCASVDCRSFWLISTRERVLSELNSRKLQVIKELDLAGLSAIESCDSLGDLLHLVDYFHVRRLSFWERRFLARFRQTYVMVKYHKCSINHDEGIYLSYWANQMSLKQSDESGACVRDTLKGETRGALLNVQAEMSASE